MASPQIENGYTTIANELLEAMARIRIPGEQRQLIDVIIRMTYGFKRKNADISIRYFSSLTGITKQSVVRARKGLLDKRIILVDKKADSKTLNYRINKDFTQWKIIRKKAESRQKSGQCVDNIAYDRRQKSGQFTDELNKTINKTINKTSARARAYDKTINYFAEKFKKQFNISYHTSKKDHNLIAQIASQHDEPTILDLIDLLFEEVETNHWLNAHCTIYTFSNKINELLIKLSAIRQEHTNKTKGVNHERDREVDAPGILETTTT